MAKNYSLREHITEIMIQKMQTSFVSRIHLILTFSLILLGFTVQSALSQWKAAARNGKHPVITMNDTREKISIFITRKTLKQEKPY